MYSRGVIRSTNQKQDRSTKYGQGGWVKELGLDGDASANHEGRNFFSFNNAASKILSLILILIMKNVIGIGQLCIYVI